MRSRSGESVAGKLVGRGTLNAAGKGRSLGSAPGLRAAAAGGEAPTWLVAAIAVALVLSAVGGIYLERRGSARRNLSTLTLIAALEDDLGDALARIASALRIPVLLAALLVLLASALEVGRFVMELIRRGLPGGRTPLAALAHRAEAEPENARELARKAPSRPSEEAVLQLAAAASSGNDKVAAEHALADYELAVQRRLDRTRIIVRAGPAIGLMGTLIPLAPGLAALGRGDLPQLASDLRTAFAATVIGLLAGTVAFALTLTRTRIYSEDLTALERAAAAIGTKPPPPVPTPREMKRERAEKERAEKEKPKAEKEKANEQEAAGRERRSRPRRSPRRPSPRAPREPRRPGPPRPAGRQRRRPAGRAGQPVRPGHRAGGRVPGRRPEPDHQRRHRPRRQAPAGAAGPPAQRTQGRQLPDPAKAPEARGRGEAVGQVYRTPDGRLIYVEK